jgi:hypothetical protein
MKEKSKMNGNPKVISTRTEYEVGYYDNKGQWWDFGKAHDIFEACEIRTRLGYRSNGGWEEKNGGWTIIEKKNTTTIRIVEEHEEG